MNEINEWFRSTKNHQVESTSDLNKSIKNIIMKLKHPKYKNILEENSFVVEITEKYFYHTSVIQIMLSIYPYRKKCILGIISRGANLDPEIPEFREIPEK